MANGITFRMVNDQTGEEAQGSADNEFALRMQGFRVVDVSAYDGAMRQYANVQRTAEPTPEELAMAEQAKADALLVSQGQFDGDTGAGTTGAGTTGQNGEGSGTNTPPTAESERREAYMSYTVDQLKSYAQTEGIDLGGATKKDDIVDALIAADKADGNLDEDAPPVA